MNKTIKLENDKLYVIYDFTEDHLRALTIILANDGIAEFENRSPDLIEDVDGNILSWETCDELVDMGLLDEDEEAYDVFFELNDDGRSTIMHVGEY